jgi:hypothetical protein
MPTVTGRKRVGVASAATPGAWRQFAVCFGLGQRRRYVNHVKLARHVLNSLSRQSRSKVCGVALLPKNVGRYADRPKDDGT